MPEGKFGNLLGYFHGFPIGGFGLIKVEAALGLVGDDGGIKKLGRMGRVGNCLVSFKVGPRSGEGDGFKEIEGEGEHLDGADEVFGGALTEGLIEEVQGVTRQFVGVGDWLKDELFAVN